MQTGRDKVCGVFGFNMFVTPKFSPSNALGNTGIHRFRRERYISAAHQHMFQPAKPSAGPSVGIERRRPDSRSRQPRHNCFLLTFPSKSANPAFDTAAARPRSAIRAGKMLWTTIHAAISPSSHSCPAHSPFVARKCPRQCPVRRWSGDNEPRWYFRLVEAPPPRLLKSRIGRNR